VKLISAMPAAAGHSVSRRDASGRVRTADPAGYADGLDAERR